jgi:glutathionylspermidine synthase
MQRAEIEERREAGKVQEVTSLQIEQLETQRIIESWRREKMSYERKQFWANKKAKEKLLEGKAYRRGKYSRAGRLDNRI